MSIFNYIDTFFFISLGITFILILLLVFHFKSLILNLEKKNDTMFEIINNIVKEINHMKNSQYSTPIPLGMNDSLNELFQHMNPSFVSMPDIKPITIHLNQAHPDFEEINDQVVSNIHIKKIEHDDEDDDEDSDDEDSDDEESDDEESDNDDSEDEESDDSDDENSANDIDENVAPVNDFAVNDTTIENDVDSIKIVNMNVGHIEQNENIDHLISSSVEYPSVNKITIPDDFEISDSIHVDSVIEQHSTEHTIDYNNMTVSELRTLVTTNHLASNASKLKKNELIQLLQNRAIQ